RPAAHERGDEVAQILAAEDPAHALGDRELDPEPAREVAQDGRGGQPFHDLADLGRGLLRRGAAGDQLPGLAIPAVAAPAGDDEVAHAGETGERLRTPAAGLAEARHLDEPPRDQRRLRVVPEAEAVDAAGR